MTKVCSQGEMVSNVRHWGKGTLLALVLAMAVDYPATAQIVVGGSKPEVEVDTTVLDRLGNEPTLPDLLLGGMGTRPTDLPAPHLDHTSLGSSKLRHSGRIHLHRPVHTHGKTHKHGDGTGFLETASHTFTLKAPATWHAAKQHAIRHDRAKRLAIRHVPTKVVATLKPKHAAPAPLAVEKTKDAPAPMTAPATQAEVATTATAATIATTAAAEAAPPVSETKSVQPPTQDTSSDTAPSLSAENSPAALPALAAPVSSQAPLSITAPSAVAIPAAAAATVPPAPISPAVTPIPALPSPPPAPEAAVHATQVAAVTAVPERESALTAPLTPGATLSSIAFDKEAARLPEGARSALRKLATMLTADPAVEIQLLAYAEADEDHASKARRLSLSRALTVRSFLIDQGVGRTRIELRALGNKVPEGPADRVDVVVQKR